MSYLPSGGHRVICGATGAGKSHLALYDIVESLEEDRPLAYLDGKGDTYRSLKLFLAQTEHGQRLCQQRGGRLFFSNSLSPSDYVLPFNAIGALDAFAWANPDSLALLANSVTSHIRRQSGFDVGDAMRMQNIMNAAISTLASGGYTLSELPLLFVPTYHRRGRREDWFNPFVESLLPSLVHMGTRSFWLDQWRMWDPRLRHDWVQSTEGRIFQYLFDERMLLTTCAVEHSRLNFRHLVDEGCWLFVNLPYAYLSDTITTVLGNLIINKIIHACMQRPLGGRPYRLVLDEARFFNTGPLDVILDTTRSYGLHLTLIVQSLSQMVRKSQGQPDYHLLAAVKENVRHWTVFQDYEDRELLAGMMYPITGHEPMWFDDRGSPLFRPTQAEENRNERRITELGFREVIMWDKDQGGPRRARTPTVRLPEAEPELLEFFEAEILRATGVAATVVRREIAERQEAVRELIRWGNKPKIEVPSDIFGGSI